MNQKIKTTAPTQDLRAAADDRWAACCRTAAVAGVWMIELLVAQALIHWQGQSIATVVALVVGVVLGLGMSIRACWECFESMALEQALRQRDLE